MYIVYLIIFLLWLGGLGGSFQPSRLIILIAPFLLNFGLTKNHMEFNGTIKFGLKIYFIWICYGILSLLWSPDSNRGLSSEIIVMIIGMMTLFLFPLLLKYEKKSLNIIRNAWVWGLIFTIPFAIYEINTMQHFVYSDEDRVLGGLGFDAPFAAIFFGNYNNYCVYICLCLPMIYWGLIETKKTILKILYSLLIVFSLFIILINTNRTSLVVFILYLLCMLKFNIKSLLTLFGIVVILIVGFRLLPPSFQETLDMLYNYRINVNYSQDTSGLIRRGVINEGFNFLIDSNFFGIGAGGFETLMLKSPEYEGISNPHNLFMEILAQYGIIIFALFLVWLFLILKKIYFNKSLNPLLKKIFYMSVLAIPLVGIINNDALGYTYWWIYFSSLIVIASIDLTKTENQGKNEVFEITN